MSGCEWYLGGSGAGLGPCGAETVVGRWCQWHRKCHTDRRYDDAHRGPNPPDTPTAGESGQAVTGDTSAPVAADIATDYPVLCKWTTADEAFDRPKGESKRALAEIEAGRNAIAALRMLRHELRIKDRENAALLAERDDARAQRDYWRKEADSWKESVDNLTRQVDDLKDAIDTADTAVTAAFATLKGYAL